MQKARLQYVFEINIGECHCDIKVEKEYLNNTEKHTKGKYWLK